MTIILCVVTLAFLLQIDKLVRLLESPIFTHVRILLLLWLVVIYL